MYIYINYPKTQKFYLRITMAKYLVETYYTCSFKVSHYLDDINENELNSGEYKLDISDVSIAINGKIVLNSVTLVNSKSDTIVFLDKVQSSFIPFFQRKKQKVIQLKKLVQKTKKLVVYLFLFFQLLNSFYYKLL